MEVSFEVACNSTVATFIFFVGIQTILWFVRFHSPVNVPLVAANFSHIVRTWEIVTKHSSMSIASTSPKCAKLQLKLLNIWHLIVDSMAFYGEKFLKNNIKHHKSILNWNGKSCCFSSQAKGRLANKCSLCHVFFSSNPLNSKLNTSDESFHFELAILKSFLSLLTLSRWVPYDVFLVCCAYKSSVSDRQFFCNESVKTFLPKFHIWLMVRTLTKHKSFSLR